MDVGIISSNTNNVNQYLRKSEIRSPEDEMIGFILRSMYEEHDKDYSYEELKNIIKYKNIFQNDFSRK